jgi:hypothetical protein
MAAHNVYELFGPDRTLVYLEIKNALRDGVARVFIPWPRHRGATYR